MYLENLTIGGLKYTITHNDDGSIDSNRPLPESVRARFADNIRGIAESGKSPGAHTDTTFHAGRGSLAKQLGGDEAWAHYITKVARSKGAVITDDHTYISQLAAYPGDPAAFIPPGEGKGYIKKLCEDRGKSCEGAVTVKAREPEPQPRVRLAEDLVQERMLHYRQTEQVTASTSDEELRHIVIEKHGQKPPEKAPEKAMATAA